MADSATGIWFLGFPAMLNLAAVAPAPDAPVDILSGVRTLFVATDSAATFKLYAKKADDDATFPYAVIEERSAREEKRFSDLVAYSVVLGLKVYAADMDVAGTLGDALWAQLKGQNPAFAGAAVSPLIAPSDPKNMHDPGRGTGGTEAFFQDREMRCRVIRPE